MASERPQALCRVPPVLQFGAVALVVGKFHAAVFVVFNDMMNR